MVSGGITSSHAQNSPVIADGVVLNLIGAGYKFTEGPASDGQGNVYFTDQPNNRILKWSHDVNEVSVFLENAGRSNGLYFDQNGNLLACADENSELWKIDMLGNVEILVKAYKGKRLNGPNDLWAHPGGGIYFTDPFYKREYWEHREKEIEVEGVYYLDPESEMLTRLIEDLKKPNGIIGTPDGKTLYVADIGNDVTWSYLIGEDGGLSQKTLFTTMGSDGMTIDEQGNIYLTGNGVTVFNKNGKKIEHIPVDRDWTANVTFGGKDNKTLFITAMNSVFTLKMKVAGARR
ncbi:SMP-30/gluconolactonase/LRE family protein [soil metagenome]